MRGLSIDVMRFGLWCIFSCSFLNLGCFFLYDLRHLVCRRFLGLWCLVSYRFLDNGDLFRGCFFGL